MMDGWRESKSWRFLLAFLMAGSIVSVSKGLFGTANEQPWWGVVLTIICSVVAFAFVWHEFRVMERDDY